MTDCGRLGLLKRKKWEIAKMEIGHGGYCGQMKMNGMSKGGKKVEWSRMRRAKIEIFSKISTEIQKTNQKIEHKIMT